MKNILKIFFRLFAYMYRFVVFPLSRILSYRNTVVQCAWEITKVFERRCSSTEASASFNACQRISAVMYLLKKTTDKREEDYPCYSFIYTAVVAYLRIFFAFFFIYIYIYFNANTESSSLIKHVWSLLDENCERYIVHREKYRNYWAIYFTKKSNINNSLLFLIFK